MLFNFALISSFFLASAVLADRRRGGRRSQSVHRVEQSTDGASGESVYSLNWAGAVWDASDGTFETVTGTFTVPVPEGSSGSAASAWVGIDGDTCPGAILQTGVDFTVTDDGVAYNAWYEWYPQDAYDFSDFDISAGDVIRASVTALSSTSGIATLENLTSGQTASMPLNSTSALCGQNAEWVVEDFSENGALVPLPNFGVTFTAAVATGPAGSYTPGDGATINNIAQKDQVLTTVSIDESTVTISHV